MGMPSAFTGCAEAYRKAGSDAPGTELMYRARFTQQAPMELHRPEGRAPSRQAGVLLAVELRRLVDGGQ
jgi:hypothetical protein